MKTPPPATRRSFVALGTLICALAGVVALSGCASLDRARTAAQDTLVERTRAMTTPQQLDTRYTAALERFGRLLEVYRAGKPPLYVQSRNIADATGLSHPLAGAELPGDITEMLRSAVNRIGERVVYVPFQPDYVIGHAQQGAKLTLTLPNVLITGAITEFDRALAAGGKGLDAGVLFGKGKGETESSYSGRATSTISRLSLDFNLVDFNTQTMLPRMQATNSMRVLNETKEDAVDVAIYGNGFGVTSNTRYLQGRHNAIRLLVDLSVLQLLGRYSAVPYWRCIPGAEPDAIVMQKISKAYAANDSTTRIKWLQDTLKDYGFALQPTGQLDDRTRGALDSMIAQFKLPPVKDAPKDYLDPALFERLFVNIPVAPVAPVTAAR